MRELHLESCVFYVSEEIFDASYRERPDITQRNVLDYLAGDDIQELANAALVSKEVRRMVKILHAHETIPSKQWSYEDAGEYYLVQRWIDRMDGTASVLIIACCNTYNLSVTSKKSSVVYPASDFNLYEAMYGEVKFKTSIPHAI